MIRLVDIMISDSDNVVAEALARQVALARNQPASFDGGAAAMDEVVGELGLPADEISLCRRQRPVPRNRISPSLLTDLIALAAQRTHPELAGDLRRPAGGRLVGHARRPVRRRGHRRRARAWSGPRPAR